MPSNGHQSKQSLYGTMPFDMIAINRLQAAVQNLTSISRADLARSLIDPRRDINAECGYPDVIDVAMYRQLYDRDPIAARIVDIMPKESWQTTPTVYEDEDEDIVTDFEAAWDDLGQSLRGEESWFQDEEGSPVWDILLRADEQSGVGHYGIILLGFDDGKRLDQPATKKKGMKLLFARPFDEVNAVINRRETDPKNKRYGKPITYRVRFSDPLTEEQFATTGGGQFASVSVGAVTTDVHWTRVIHLADNMTNSDIAGVPRMKRSFNRLMDLQKLYGCSAEGFWKNGIAAKSWETHPQLGGDVDIDIDAFRNQIEQFNNGLQRDMVTSGLAAKMLAPAIADPTPQIMVQIEAICIILGCPKRVFMGSERGELASSQDDGAWNDRLRMRQNNYITPKIIVPFIDRLIQLGVLPEPKGYSIAWQDLDSLSKNEKAAIAVQETTAITTFAQGNGETMMSPMSFWTDVMGRTQEEAKQIIDDVVEHLEESNPDTEQPLMPGHPAAAPPPEEQPPQPMPPIKVKEGERLVSPEDGSPVGNFNPNHDDAGRFSEGSGSDNGGESSKHDIPLPKNSKKLNLDTANKALTQMGYKVGKGEFSHKAQMTVYTLTKPDGSTTKATTDEIKEIVYRGRKQ